MADARSRERWAHTSVLLAMLANTRIDTKKTRLYKPADFNPHLHQRDEPVAKVGIQALKVFLKNGEPPCQVHKG